MKKYIVVEIDGFIHTQICENGRPSKYGNPKKFDTKEDAQKWIDRKSYKGMSWRYEISPIYI